MFLPQQASNISKTCSTHPLHSVAVPAALRVPVGEVQASHLRAEALHGLLGGAQRCQLSAALLLQLLCCCCIVVELLQCIAMSGASEKIFCDENLSKVLQQLLRCCCIVVELLQA
jgi:hypothetical protein